MSPGVSGVGGAVAQKPYTGTWRQTGGEPIWGSKCVGGEGGQT